MAKADNRPKEKMRLVIEFADNGIILRNPECVDDVKLALMGNGIQKAYGYDADHTEEYKAIGKDIYDWLIDVVVNDHSSEMVATGAELSITATLNGRIR